MRDFNTSTFDWVQRYRERQSKKEKVVLRDKKGNKKLLR